MYRIVSEKLTRFGTDAADQRISVKLVQINCDTAADIPEPEAGWEIGSFCFILDTQEVKFLNSRGEWV